MQTTQKTQLTRDDLPDALHATAQDDHSWDGVALKAVDGTLNGELYGILVKPEDVPAVIQQIPDTPGDDLPALLSHTSAFPSKFDLRDRQSGLVMTQINFGSVPPNAQILDLRGREPPSVWSRI